MDPQQELARALQFHRSGRLADAERAYRAILAKAPKSVDALNLLGSLLVRRNQVEDGIPLLQQANRLRPGQPAIMNNLATALRRHRRIDEAISLFREIARREPKSPRPHYEIANTLEAVHRLDEAGAAIDNALALSPADPHANLLRARLDRRKREFAAARARLTPLLDALPADAPPSIRGKLWNELGMNLDKLGEHDAAFDAFDHAATAFQESAEYRAMDSPMIPDLIEKYRAYFKGSDEPRSWTVTDRPTPAPTFIVGFPRSGTTMTENIIAAHPDVETSDENPFLQDGVIRQLRGVVGNDPNFTFPEIIGRLTDAQVDALRERYWDRVEQDIPGARSRPMVIDKIPFNLIHLGLINRVFPESRIILVIRDPRDVVLSNFMQEFLPTQFTVHLVTLERTANLYRRALSLWLDIRTSLTLAIHQVRYEDIVADFEARARELIEFLELPWHDDVLRFHEIAAKRLVTTPSYEAITRPVNPDAKGRWHRYSRHLERVFDDLEPFVREFGYGEDSQGPGA